MNASSASCARPRAASKSWTCSTRPIGGPRDGQARPDRPATGAQRRPGVNPSDLRDERPEAVGPPDGAAAGPGPDPPAPGADPPVARRQVQILNAFGLHMRPANMFVKLACGFRETEIRVYYKDREVNGKSILDLVTLAAECGTRV